MGWEQDNNDYAKERGMNISPFRSEYGLFKFLSSTGMMLGLIPMVVALRSLWMGAVSIAFLLLIVNSQDFKFMWDSAPWFKATIGWAVLGLTPIVVLVAVVPLPWLAGIALIAAMLFWLGYYREYKAFVRQFNIPDRDP